MGPADVVATVPKENTLIRVTLVQVSANIGNIDPGVDASEAWIIQHLVS